MKTLHRSILALLVGLALTACTSAHVYADALQLDFFLAGFQDVSGAPVSGGIVVTRNSANSAAKAVWEDKDQTLPSAGGKAQFSLDSEGRAVVFGDGVYTVLIYDSADTGLTSPLYTFSGVTYETNASSLALKVDKAGDIMTGNLSLNNSTDASPGLVYFTPTNSAAASIDLNAEVFRVNTSHDVGGALTPVTIPLNTGLLYNLSNRVLTTADEGSGNGLDADTVDGLHAADLSGLVGDGTTGRTLRRSNLIIEDGSNPSTLKVTLVDFWNGNTIAVTDNIGKSTTVGAFTLNSLGSGLTFAVDTDLITPVSVDIYINATSTSYFMSNNVVGGEFSITLRALGSTTLVDMTAAVDVGAIYTNLTYLTDQ